MRTAHKLLLMGNRAPVTWSSYVTSLAPVGWWSMRATSGTNEANRGSGGSALDMTITSSTLGQTGKLGVNEAFTLDGANSRLQTANNAALANLTTWEYVFLINPSSAGETSVGRFFAWGNGGADSSPTFGFNSAITSIIGAIYNTTPTAFVVTTTTGLTASAWQFLFIAYDNAGDRKIHVYKGVSGVVSEFAYSVQDALTGTYRAPSVALNLFARSDQAGVFAGLGDEVFINGATLTGAQRTQLTTLAGV